MSCDNEFAPDIPIWRLRFVQDEVRPFLVRLRQVAEEACNRWEHKKQCQLSDLKNWEYRKRAFLKDISLSFDYQRCADDGNPHEGNSWPGEWSTHVTGTFFDQDIPRLMMCWGPPEFAYENEPKQYMDWPQGLRI